MDWMAIFMVMTVRFSVNIDETKTKVVALLSDIKIWMRERKLKQNESKTEILLIKG